MFFKTYYKICYPYSKLAFACGSARVMVTDRGDSSNWYNFFIYEMDETNT